MYITCVSRCICPVLSLLSSSLSSLLLSSSLFFSSSLFSHSSLFPTGHHFSANEVIMCAENQILAGDEAMQSPFVTVVSTISKFSFFFFLVKPSKIYYIYIYTVFHLYTHNLTFNLTLCFFCFFVFLFSFFFFRK